MKPYLYLASYLTLSFIFACQKIPVGDDYLKVSAEAISYQLKAEKIQNWKVFIRAERGDEIITFFNSNGFAGNLLQNEGSIDNYKESKTSHLAAKEIILAVSDVRKMEDKYFVVLTKIYGVKNSETIEYQLEKRKNNWTIVSGKTVAAS